MNSTEELLQDSDSSDDDYVPDEKVEVLSEIDSDGDPENDMENEEYKNQKSKKRTKNRRQPRKKQKKTEDSCIILCTKSEDLSEEDRRKKEEDIWADFMKDTGFQSRKGANNTSVPVNKVDSLSSGKVSNEKVDTHYKVDKKVKITKIFEFAGEEVRVEKEVPANSAESRLLNTSSPQNIISKSKGRFTGISGILNQLGKKSKINTLEKSKLDWDKFKKEENLEEELQNYNKGKDGYLEKQDFLQRADLRRFEIEREVRTIERNRRSNNLL